jgi:spermidine/putrescine transport system substrate-binding protein
LFYERSEMIRSESDKGEAMRRVGGLRGTLALITAITMLAVACGDSGGNAGGGDKPFAGQTLIATAYSGPYYDAFKEIMVPAFEERTGATIQFIPTNGEELSELSAAPEGNPPYDVVMCPGPDYIRGIKQNLYEELVPADIPNMADLTDFHKQDFGFGLTTKYGVPFDFGVFVLAYNKETLGFTPTSYADLWRPEVQGEIGLDAIYWYQNASAAALLLDDDPGLEEMYEPVDSAAWDDIVHKLQELNVAQWFQTGAEMAAALERGDISMAIASLEIVSAMAKADPDKFGMVVPSEAAVGYIDYFCIARGTDKVPLANEWLNTLLDPELQARWADSVPYYLSNSKTQYSAFAQPIVDGEREGGQLLDYGYIASVFDAVDARLKQEVYSS